MLNVQDIANFLNTELDKIGKLQGYHFDIQAEVGASKNDDAILGIVSTTKALPKVDGNSSDYEFTIELSVPSSKTNENIIKIQKIIGKLKSKFHMKKRAFGGGSGTLMFTLAKPNNYEIKYVVADHVPVVFTISTTFVVGGVGSADKHWLLNGMEIPFINENLYVEKDGRTNAVNGKNYTKTLLTRQTRVYKFGFDYDNSELCIMLQKDLLDGRFDKVYTLTYYDGVSFTEEKPFTTSVSIFKNSVSGSSKPNIAEFDITFTDVDNEFEGEYYMALIDNPFDSTTENTLYFETEEKQREYYQGKIDNDIRIGGVGCQFVRIKAPNLSSIDITNQVYEIPLNNGEPIYDVLSVTNKNYAIIKVKKGEDEQWFYYYVSNQNIGGQNQVMFDLKLDSLQTYYIGDKLQFGDCLIERGHENRWIDNGDGTVSFDGTVNSRLFEREDIQNVAKRLVKRTKVDMYNTGNEELDNWLNNAVIGWIYMFLKPQTKISKSDTAGKDETDSEGKGTAIFDGNFVLQYDSIQSERQYPNIAEKGIYSQFPVVAFPVYKSAEYQIAIEGEISENGILYDYVDLNRSNYLGISSFLEKNNGETMIYALKFSTIPPFNSNFEKEFEISYNEITQVNMLKIKGTKSNFSNSIKGAISVTTKTKDYLYGIAFKGHEGGLVIVNQKPNHITKSILIDKELKFTKQDIITSNKNVKFNPKLLSSDYYSISLSDETENGFEYDLQKLNTNLLEPVITEPIVSDFAKKYIRFKTNGVYSPDSQKALIGFVSTDDNSLALSSTQYQTMLANNKNYFLQNQIGRGFEAIGGLGNMANKTMSGFTAGGGAGAVAGAISGAADIAINYARSKIGENLTVDNLKNAPSIVSQGRGNAYFNAMHSELGVIIEEWDILPNEKEIINDYMCKFGFTVNRFGNPKDYDNIRHYYNYVKAQIDSISGIAISNQARDDIRQRFANGVRFWKQDNIDYSKENYEEWLAQ